MRNLIMAGIFSLVAFCFASDFAEAAQAKSTWKTSVKITCDRTVAEGSAIDVFLCEDNTCNRRYPADPIFPNVGIRLDCGTNLGMRSAGGRFETDFKPALFKYSFEVRDASNVLMCLDTADEPQEMPYVGSTVKCDESSRSPKLTVGRPH